MEIVLADDDAGTRDLLKRALESDGHNVSVARDGAEAAEIIATDGGRFDLLIADVDMPGLDGISVAKKAREAQTAIAVVLISAHESEWERAAGIPGSKVETRAKPFTLEEIRSAIVKARGG